jgi:hypothetical protein
MKTINKKKIEICEFLHVSIITIIQLRLPNQTLRNEC